jgi:hypothetical protein
MRQRSITRICAIGALAAGLGLTGAGPALAAPQAHHAAASAGPGSPATMRKCSGEVCETVTLTGNTIKVLTTARGSRHYCITPSVTIVALHVHVIARAKPRCNQTHPYQVFSLHIKKLTRPVIIFAQWSRTLGAPSVIFK